MLERKGGLPVQTILILILILTLSLLSTAGAGQLPARRPLTPVPPPDFDLILSYVTVTASKGVAPRLSAKDFQLFEDDKEQKIDSWSVLPSGRAIRLTS